MRDNLDLLVKRLGRLLDVLEGKEFGKTVTRTEKNVTVNNEVRTDEPSGDNTPNYFSTGKERVAVENVESWERLDFGIAARVLNIRTTDDIVVAFANPNRSGPEIKVRQGDATQESPFVIGGDVGIDTAFLWVKQAETASGTPGIELIAYR